ncbi:hypothetical protein AnigIFM56816_008979 [Aspergillus niger]|nr:hypothetical protein AnigIFM56816_008979 [Aspergillus niger]GKZ94544.1 hypothetical protein AnigIFM59636_007919 [Aspergillus niger]GLA34530.1 hypothetical protein AnigIFM63309_007079 [Aspergillus niger]
MADAKAAVADRWSFRVKLVTQVIPVKTACFQDAVTDRRTRNKQSVDLTLLDDFESVELDLVEKTNGKTNKKKNVITSDSVFGKGNVVDDEKNRVRYDD